MHPKTKILPVFALALTVGLFSCQKTQTPEPASRTTIPKLGTQAKLGQPDCPPGYHLVLVYEYDRMRFHRPKKNCESGFYICSDGHWEWVCVPDYPMAAIVGQNASIWGQLNESETQLELHFPAGLASTPGYTANDLSVFSVDDAKAVRPDVVLVPGAYAVSLIGSELVVTVPVTAN